MRIFLFPFLYSTDRFFSWGLWDARKEKKKERMVREKKNLLPSVKRRVAVHVAAAQIATTVDSLDCFLFIENWLFISLDCSVCVCVVVSLG